MDMPKRRRWFNGMVSPQRRNGLLPVTGNHRLQSPTAFEAHEAECQTDCDQDGWPQGFFAIQLGSQYAVTLSNDCPPQLLTALQPGDVMELVPDTTIHGAPAVRVDYGIFQVGYLDCSQRSLLWRLMMKDFHVFGRVAKIESTATGHALWLTIYLGD